MLITVLLVLIAALAYCLGSINGAIIVSRLMFGSDVREMGSGNAGLTNFYRSFGPRGIAGVVGIDAGKGVLAALLGGLLLGLAGTEALRPEFQAVGRLFATFCLILGHAFPAFHELRGGKGILCGAAAIFVVDYRAGFICLLVFALAVVVTHYVSLGSILGAISVPITLLARGFSGLSLTLVCFSVALIVCKHGANIVRILRHTESRLEFRRDITHKLDGDDF